MKSSNKADNKYNRIGSTIYKELANLLPQTVFEIKLDGTLIFGNQTGLKMFGYTLDDMKRGMNVLNLIIPEERERALNDFNMVIRGKKGTGTEYTALRKDNSVFSIIIYASPIFKYGKPFGLRGFLIDIDERKKIESELKESEHRFRDLTEKSLVGIYLIQDNTFIYVNSTFASIFGYTVKEMQGLLGPKDITADCDRELVLGRIRQRITNEIESINYQFKGLTRHGKTIDVEVYGSRTSVNGKPAVVGSLIDITERKKAEEELRYLSKRNEIILSTAADGFHILNSSGSIMQVNSALCEITGYDEQELLNSDVNSLYLLGKETLYDNLSHIHINDKSSHLFEAKIKRKDKSVIDVEVHANILKLETESLFFLSVRNISERILSAQKIRQLSTAVEQSPVSIVITDTNGIIEYVNPRFCNVTGFLYEEVVGQSTQIIRSDKYPEEFYKDIHNTLQEKKEWNGEVYSRKKNGELYWEQVKVSPIIDNHGNITQYIAIKEDITKKKQTEIELKHARDKSEEMIRLKTSFLANMNHELRTPLIGILGFADILFDELRNPEQKEMAHTILDSGKRLLECLNMILDLSRLEADQLEFEFVSINCGKAVKEIYQSFKQAAFNKNLHYKLEINDDKLISRVDNRIFTQIVSNILNNAIKFTAEGEVRVTVQAEYVNDKPYNVITISDTGIGISLEEQKIIFEEFRQAKEGYNRPYEGTGLGLTITKKFVELMGGNLILISEPGKGTIIKVRFPSLQKKSFIDLNHLQEVCEEEFSMPTLLSVETDPSSVKIIQYFLKNLCTIEHAYTGEDAIKKIKNNRYNVIMMDINPGIGITGMEAVKEIKKFPHCQDIPIIAVTSYAFQGDKYKLLKNGFSHHLLKPFDRRVLVEVISDILKN